MSSYKLPRRLFLLTAVASCGFEPVLQNNAVSDFRGKVQLPGADDQDSYIMRRELVKQFGEPVSPLYALEYEYSTSTRTLAVTQNNTITRARLTATGVFKATKLNTNEVILNQEFKRVASYSSNSDRYASDRAKIAAEEKLIVSLAQEFATRFINAVAQQ